RLSVPPQHAGTVERRACRTEREVGAAHLERDVVEAPDIRCECSAAVQQEALRIAADGAVALVQARAAAIDRLTTERNLAPEPERAAAAAPVGRTHFTPCPLRIRRAHREHERIRQLRQAALPR